METIWLAKRHICTVWHFTEKVCGSLLGSEVDGGQAGCVCHDGGTLPALILLGPNVTGDFWVWG